MNNRVDINRLLVEMRSLKSQTQMQGIQPQGLDGAVQGGRGVDKVREVPSFSEIMGQAVNKVNDTQKASSALQSAYQSGDPNVDVTDVMIASQKASVSFQAATQVRNKLIDAYRDVMNMPI